MHHPLRLRRLGIDTYRQPIVFLSADCPVSRAEGFEALTRVLVENHGPSVVAVLNVVTGDLVRADEVGLSEVAWRMLGGTEGQIVHLSHPPPLDSFARVRAKIDGHRFDEAALAAIIDDVARGHYGDAHLAAFLTACAARGMTIDETAALTRSMVAVGDRLSWPHARVVDKHCVGGLPGNRTTPIVVAIVAAAGLVIPKTSSRAITSPAGTADAMETLAPVDLDLPTMRRVVEQEGGCVVWGGAMRLSPVDDVLIGVEHPLNLDAEGQLVASILSKKVAAGSTHVLIDVPVGPTAKVRSDEAAARLVAHLGGVAERVGLVARVVVTDGRAPVGRGIGPALEARDILAVVARDSGAPADLRARALDVAAAVIALGKDVDEAVARREAETILDGGGARRKLEAICEAQGGLREPPVARHQRPIGAPHAGVVEAIDNTRISELAKLAGAPRAKAAGLYLHVRLGQRVEAGEPLFTLHSEAAGELDYASHYAGRWNAVTLSVILPFPGQEPLASAIAAHLGDEVGAVELHRFPDGESLVRLPDLAGQPAIVVCTLDRPDPKLVPLSFLCATARDLGASRVVLVAPYLCYMRQDRRFRPGESVGARLFPRLLGRDIDALVTVDPHLHRIHDLAGLYPGARVVHAAPLLAAYIAEQVERPVLVGPDEESAQWVGAVAGAIGAPFVVARKTRRGDRDVVVDVPDVPADCTPVLVDDVVATGRTLLAVAQVLRARGQEPLGVAVHGLFTDGDLGLRVVTCNTVPHPSNAIDVSAALAAELRAI